MKTPTFPSKAEEIRTYLLSEQRFGRIPKAIDVAKLFSVSRVYVHEIRSQLITGGLLYPSPRGRSDRKTPGERLSISVEQQASAAATAALRLAATPLANELATAGKQLGLDLAQPLIDFRAERDQLSASLESGDLKPMTPDQRRAFLSHLALNTAREEIKVSAIAALNRLEASLRTGDAVGPRNPLTAEEADERLRDLHAARDEVFGVAPSR